MSYYDIHDLLAEELPVPCKLRNDILGLGHLEPGNTKPHLEQGAQLLLPLWLSQVGLRSFWRDFRKRRLGAAGRMLCVAALQVCWIWAQEACGVDSLVASLWLANCEVPQGSATRGVRRLGGAYSVRTWLVGGSFADAWGLCGCCESSHQNTKRNSTINAGAKSVQLGGFPYWYEVGIKVAQVHQPHGLCTVYCVLCTVYCVLCTVYCVLCTVLCTVFVVLSLSPVSCLSLSLYLSIYLSIYLSSLSLSLILCVIQVLGTEQSGRIVRMLNTAFRERYVEIFTLALHYRNEVGEECTSCCLFAVVCVCVCLVYVCVCVRVCVCVAKRSEE
jgi:hypothetical protein